MPRIKAHSRRTAIILTVVLLVAFIGLTAINISNADADGQTATTTGLSKATQAQTDSDGAAFKPAVPTGSIVKMVSALVIVVFSIYFCVMLLKKFLGRKYGGRGGENLLEVLETTYVGPKKMVSLVRVADKSVLIGVTDQSISMLTELDADATAELAGAKGSVPQDAGFASFMKSATTKIKEMTTGKNQAALENR